MTKEERKQKVQDFQAACLQAGLRELAPYVFELNVSAPKTLTLCTLIHGNEIVGLEIFLQMLEEMKNANIRPKLNLRMILGNVEAYFEDKRFLTSDMNRSFGLSDPETSEEIRAKQIEPFLKSTDVLIDFHQTIGPSKSAFLIFEFHEESYNFARYLLPEFPLITYKKSRPIKGKTTTGLVIANGGLGITIETGQKGLDQNQQTFGIEVLRRILNLDFAQDFPIAAVTNTFTFYQIVQNPKRNLELIKTFQNFAPVAKGELLVQHEGEEIRSEVDGVVLFAKYGDYAKATDELALILKPVSSREEI